MPLFAERPCAAGSLCVLTPDPTPLSARAQVPNLMQSSDLVPIYENIRTRAKQAGMDQNKDQLYSFFVQEVGPHTSERLGGSGSRVAGHRGERAVALASSLPATRMCCGACNAL